MTLNVMRVDERAVMPTFAHDNGEDACFDISALLPDGVDGVEVKPGETVLVRTGLVFDPEPGYSVRIHVRSSIGFKRHLIMSNCTGVIDNGYRGEVMIALTNIGDTVSRIEAGERVCQGEVVKDRHVVIREVDSVTCSARGAGGIGSTGRM